MYATLFLLRTKKIGEIKTSNACVIRSPIFRYDSSRAITRLVSINPNFLDKFLEGLL